MKRLKQLRELMRITQAELAKKLHTTQQTVARWESGKTQPDISALKDLALFFHTSVDDLLEYAKTGKRIKSSLYWIGDKDRDGFWGHVGVKIANNLSVWFPVTAYIAKSLENVLFCMSDDKEWVLFPTLANQYVAIHPSAVTKVTVLDDDADHPQDDWNLTYPYDGLPLELYRGFETWGGTGFPEKEARTLLALYDKKQKGKLGTTEQGVYRDLIKKLKADFETPVSEYFLISTVSNFISEGLVNSKKFAYYMWDVNLYYTDGRMETFMDEPDILLEMLNQLEAPAEYSMLRLASFQEGRVFVPLSKVGMLTMPYLTVLDKEKEREDELAKNEEREE